MVWTYLHFNDIAVETAKQTDMPYHFSLGEKLINKVGDRHIGRLLLNTETDLATIKNYLNRVDE